MGIEEKKRRKGKENKTTNKGEVLWSNLGADFLAFVAKKNERTNVAGRTKTTPTSIGLFARTTVFLQWSTTEKRKMRGKRGQQQQPTSAIVPSPVSTFFFFSSHSCNVVRFRIWRNTRQREVPYLMGKHASSSFLRAKHTITTQPT